MTHLAPLILLVAVTLAAAALGHLDIMWLSGSATIVAGLYSIHELLKD